MTSNGSPQNSALRDGGEGGGAPAFAEARNPRQKARTAGLHPEHWYAMEYASRVPVGTVIPIKFWNRAIALFRGADGQLRALDDRCAHRHVPLSLGEVSDCTLTCPYHGWSYDGDGRLMTVPHEQFGRDLSKVRIRSYPVKERYGLVWLFPGDPAMAASIGIPEIPELEGPHRWACVPLDFVWKAHHSIIIDNVSDFTHAYLHRRFRPFEDAKLRRCETVGDRVELSYDVGVGRGRISSLFVDAKTTRTDRMELAFEYPYQWSNTDNKIKHWCFLLPIDERTTRVFFLFYFDRFKVPFTPLSIPRSLMVPFLRLANALMIRPLLSEDGVVVEAEQRAYDKSGGEPFIEFNPAVLMFQKLIGRRWEDHLQSQQAAPARQRAEIADAPRAPGHPVDG